MVQAANLWARDDLALFRELNSPGLWSIFAQTQVRPGAVIIGQITLLTVRWAKAIPSLSNSPWMRGAPQNGLARVICPMRAIVSGATLWRPALGARLFHFQKRRKPCRCQWITVSGWTSRSACLHRLQINESQTQRTRSEDSHRGRWAFRLRTRSC